jgi:glucan phosphoethanolaminetransferase (alkaline phosphatase superfamily)
MKTIRNSILALALVVGMGGLFVATPAYAVTVQDDCTAIGVNPDSAVCSGGDEQIQPIIKTVINTLLYILGALAVIMIIFAGFRYTTSGGDANAVTSAKKTLLYSVVGLIVAILSYAIVNTVLDELLTKPKKESAQSSANQSTLAQSGDTLQIK